MSAHVLPCFSPAERAWSLAAVIAANFGLGLAYGMSYPLTALTFERWGAAPWLTGVAGAAPAVAVLLTLPIVPGLARRLGTVPAMLIGCALYAGGFLLMPMLPSPGAWIAFRFLMGVGITLPWLISETWLNTVADDGNRGRVMAMFVVSLFAGFAAGPLAVEHLGIEGAAAFAVGAAAMALTALPLFLARRLAPEVGGRGDGAGGLLRAARLAPLSLAGAVAAGTAEMGFLALLPVYAIASGVAEGAALRLLAALMLGGLALQLAVGWLSDRLRSRAALLAALALACAGLTASLPLTVSEGWLGLANAFLLGGAVLGFYSVSLTMLGERVRGGDLALANAAFIMAYQVGAMAGPAIGGAALGWERAAFPALIAGVALALAAATAAVAWRGANPDRPARAP